MSNTFEYVSIFQQELDKAAVATATSGWMELNDKLIKYNGGADVKIPSITMDGLADYDRQEGYTDGAVNLKYETKTMTQDRGRRFTLDAMDVNESNFVATASSVMGEFQRTHVVPEIDAYRYSSIAAQAIKANQAIYGYTPEEATILAALLDDIAAIQDVVGDGTPLMISMAVKVAAIFDRSEKLSKSLSVVDFKQGDVTMKVKSIDGQHPIIRVGFAPGVDAKDINWIICPRTTPIAVSRTDKVRIFDPETYQKANAWAVDYRKYHDLWIPSNKLNTIKVNIQQAKG